MNDRGVRGQHYVTQSGIEHWDWVFTCELDYFCGNASKYIVRWKEKGGVNDLRKALSYVEKLLAIYGDEVISRRRTRTPGMYRATRQLCAAYDLSSEEAEVIYGLMEWYNYASLQEVAENIRELIPDMGKAQPVPLTEENHYSERANTDEGDAY
jgi:hypothetical protein